MIVLNDRFETETIKRLNEFVPTYAPRQQSRRSQFSY
jgi:hypothetical protein